MDLALNIDYGYNILETSKKVQERVKTAIENMTGLTVSDVNVRIASVEMEIISRPFTIEKHPVHRRIVLAGIIKVSLKKAPFSLCRSEIKRGGRNGKKRTS